jgi:hypothetical protein
MAKLFLDTFESVLVLTNYGIILASVLTKSIAI